MARIPIIKLNNGNTSYYPLSVGESTVTTHTIEVKNNIGGYQKGEIIPAVTTFDEILTNLFEIEGAACPTRNAISAVRFSPTTPRMPSVPKSLPISSVPFCHVISLYSIYIQLFNR